MRSIFIRLVQGNTLGPIRVFFKCLDVKYFRAWPYETQSFSAGWGGMSGGRSE